MTFAQIEGILQQGKDLGTLDWIYFEGGEPFLFYPVLKSGVDLARSHGFKVGLVSNAYWATSERDAEEWLKPFAGKVLDLSISCDLYHGDERMSLQASHAVAAAGNLGIPVVPVSIAQPVEMNRSQLPEGQSSLRYRGRAAETLTTGAHLHSWKQFTSCPYEELRKPARVHVDSFGYVHICQGITIGNLFEKPLSALVAEYEPEAHPVIGLLLSGGPAALWKAEEMEREYADACHLCFSARRLLREQFPGILAPKQMYEGA